MKDSKFRWLAWWVAIVFSLFVWAALLTAVFAVRCHATLVPLTMVAPTTNDDSPREPWDPCDTTGCSRLTSLDAILVWGQRCGQADSTLIATVPALGMEGDTIRASVDFPAGHTYWVWTRTRKLNGLTSLCRGPQLVLAVPAVP